MSDAIRAGAEALHRARQSACNHHTGGPAECDSQAMTVLDAATADVEAMARVLFDADFSDFTDAERDQAWRTRTNNAWHDQAQELRDWMLGGGG